MQRFAVFLFTCLLYIISCRFFHFLAQCYAIVMLFSVKLHKDVQAVFSAKTAGADDGVDVAAPDAALAGNLTAVLSDMSILAARVEAVPRGGRTERIVRAALTAKAPDDTAIEPVGRNGKLPKLQAARPQKSPHRSGPLSVFPVRAVLFSPAAPAKFVSGRGKFRQSVQLLRLCD